MEIFEIFQDASNTDGLWIVYNYIQQYNVL